MALRPLYLVDKSAWEQRRYNERARDCIGRLRETGQLAICVITMTELLYSARNVEEIDVDHSHLAELKFLPMTPAAEQQVVATLRALAAKGQHRGRPIPDLLLAAIAKVHGAVVLHYDHDFELIADVTDQPHEWIIPRGTGHGNDDHTRV